MNGKDTEQKSLKEKIIRIKEHIVTHMTMAILRPFNRHKMIHLDHVQLDADNPIVLNLTTHFLSHTYTLYTAKGNKKLTML